MRSKLERSAPVRPLSFVAWFLLVRKGVSHVASSRFFARSSHRSFRRRLREYRHHTERRLDVEWQLDDERRHVVGRRLRVRGLCFHRMSDGGVLRLCQWNVRQWRSPRRLQIDPDELPALQSRGSRLRMRWKELRGRVPRERSGHLGGAQRSVRAAPRAAVRKQCSMRQWPILPLRRSTGVRRHERPRSLRGNSDGVRNDERPGLRVRSTHLRRSLRSERIGPLGSSRRSVRTSQSGLRRLEPDALSGRGILQLARWLDVRRRRRTRTVPSASVRMPGGRRPRVWVQRPDVFERVRSQRSRAQHPRQRRVRRVSMIGAG